MNKQKEIKKLFFLILLFSFGVLLRISFIPAKTLDMDVYIQWYSSILKNGIINSLGSQSFGYNPPFVYLLALATLTHSFLQPIVSIKLISISFDIINAIFVYHIVRTQYQDTSKPQLATLIFWVAPTVILNSSFWGQTDSLYICFLLLMLFLLLKEKPTLALAAFAISIAIKAQGIIIVPFLGVLFLKKRIPFFSFFIVPLVYIATFIPAIMAGRSFTSLFSTYKTQTETFANVSMNAPNLYFFVEPSNNQIGLYIGIILATIILSIWLLVYGLKKYKFNKSLLVYSALVSVTLVPFVLPKMHDRYFYPADVLSIIMAFFLPEFWVIPIAYQFISFSSYLPYLFGISKYSTLPYAIIVNTIVIVFLLWKQWNITSNNDVH